MFYVGAFGLAFGAFCPRWTSLLTMAVSAAVAAIGAAFIDSAVSHSALHAVLAGLRVAWSLELGLFAGLAFDQLVMRADPA